MNDSKPKSVLGKAAEALDEPINPWWKDPGKLVAAALQTSRRKELIAGLVDLASNDEAFRRQMLTKFDALGAGKKAPPGRPYWQKVMIVDHVESFREILRETGRPSSISDVCAYISHLFNLSPKSVENLYYQLRNDPDIRKSLDR